MQIAHEIFKMLSQICNNVNSIKEAWDIFKSWFIDENGERNFFFRCGIKKIEFKCIMIKFKLKYFVFFFDSFTQMCGIHAGWVLMS